MPRVAGLLLLLAGSCGVGPEADGPGDCAALPTGGVLAVFQMGDETFRAHVTNPDGVAQAFARWQERAAASIPVGELVCEPRPWNCGWTWHLDPATVQLAEVTIEVCDGTPSYVEAHCEAFGERYCPWGARLVELRDCRADPTCPVAPR